jgi:rhodanese-related sulfurtransferase
MKKYLFLILTVPLVALIILALPGSKSFRLSGEMILDQIGQNTHIISVQKFKELSTSVQGVQLVDLRGADEFNTGHLPEAINMPVESLNTADIHRFFEGIDSDCVLYSGETYQANKQWILFRQMGIENIFVLETGPTLDPLIINWDSENSRRIMVDEDPTFTFQPDTALTF